MSTASARPSQPSPDWLLREAKRSGRTYDEIGFRIASGCERGLMRLQTLAGFEERLAHAERPSEAPSLDFARLRELIDHRPIGAPDGRVNYTIDAQNLLLRLEPADDLQVVGWTYPLSQPPPGMLELAVDNDVEVLPASQASGLSLPGVGWLPLTVLIETGRLQRMQDWSERLETTTRPGSFYTFMSHRWLTPTHPDPAGLQAGLIAWQLLAHLCEAVMVASLRGLHTPRRFHPMLGFVVGIAGSELAELLLVNVLRSSVDARSLASMFEEVRSIEHLLEDRGLDAAMADPDLATIRESLRQRPGLQACASRICLWYDYSCMPQEPRTPPEQAAFEAGLRQLNRIQTLCHTSVLLDEVTDYLSRGWCLLEAVFADSVAPSPLQVLDGGTTVRPDRQEAEVVFRQVLRDRPHQVWRALLDTEVFAVQSPDECMARLGLATTRPQDVALVYSLMRALPAPTTIHMDGSELLTGCVPLPIQDDAVVLPCSEADVARTLEAMGSLDWTACLTLQRDPAAETDGQPTLPPPFSELRAHVPDAGHLVVIASCEGEAAAIMAWACRRLSELEAILERPICSASWLSSDISPVGHMGFGDLQFAAVDAEAWVFLAASARMAHCPTTRRLRDAVGEAGKSWLEFGVDVARENVGRFASGPAAARRSSNPTVKLSRFRPPTIRGGAFRDDYDGLLQHLAEPA
jgi:hypothetical protein